jgi:hypothetical protein
MVDLRKVPKEIPSVHCPQDLTYALSHLVIPNCPLVLHILDHRVTQPPLAQFLIPLNSTPVVR